MTITPARASWAQRIDHAMAHTGVLNRDRQNSGSLSTASTVAAAAKDPRIWIRTNGFRPGGSMSKGVKTTRTRCGMPMTTTCILEASSLGQLDVLYFLKEKECWLRDVSLANSEGRTPLFLAAQAGYLNVAVFLFENGAADDVRRKDNNGHTPLQAARSFGHRKVVRWLLSVSGEGPSEEETLNPAPMRDPYKTMERRTPKRRARSKHPHPPERQQLTLQAPVESTALAIASPPSEMSSSSSISTFSALTPSQAPPGLLDYLKQTFAEHDTSGTGTLAWKELWWLMKGLGLGVTDREVAKMQTLANRLGVNSHAPVTFLDFAPVAMRMLKDVFDARHWVRNQADAEAHGGIRASVRLFDTKAKAFYIYNMASGHSEWVVPNDAKQAMRAGTPLLLHRDSRQAAAREKFHHLFGHRHM